MARRPRVLIPSGSPLTEPVAVAIASALTRNRTPSALPSIVTASSLEDFVGKSGSLVFVGWQGDLEESRELASEILAALARSHPRGCSVALFESGPAGDRAAGTEPVTGPTKVCHGLRFLGPAERFVVAPQPGEGPARDTELLKAREWAARVYEAWRNAPRERSARAGPEPASEPPAWTGWCGAFE